MNPIVNPLRFDKTGQAPANKVVAEYHNIAMYNGSAQRAFVLDKGYFYDNEHLRLRDLAGYDLIKGVDYKTTYLHGAVSAEVGQMVCGLIVITNPKVGSEFYVDAQMVGGDYCNTTSVLLKIVTSLGDTDGATVEWTRVTNRPTSYTPVGHRVALWDLYGFEEWSEEIARMTGAVFTKSTIDTGKLLAPIAEAYAEMVATLADMNAFLQAHITNTNRPHVETTLQLGLDLVGNYLISSSLEAREGTDLRSYMTPGRAKDAVDTNFLVPLDLHLANANNPHRLTSEQLSVYQARVQNQMLIAKLPVQATAADTTLFAGVDYASAQADMRANLNALEINTERVAAVRLGTNPGPGTLLIGDNRWFSTASIFNFWHDTTRNKTIYVGYMGNSAQAKATIIATFTDFVTYPIGTFLLFSEARSAVVVSGNGTLTIVSQATNLAIRNAGGWIFAL